MIRIHDYFIGSIISLSAVILFAATEAPAAWLDGVMSSTYTTNCVSMIQGAPYTETLTMEYVGYGGNLTLPPKVGDVYYGRIVWGTTGNPCAGPYVHPEVALPQYTEFAIDATHPIECWTEKTGVAGSYQQITDGSCPTQPGMGLYGNGFYSFDTRAAGTWGGGPWPTAQGRMYYIYFPIKSSKPLAGMAGTGTLLVGAIQALDGNNPWDGPQAGWNGLNAPSSGPYTWITVQDYVATITNLAVTNITASTARVSGTLNHNGAKGSVYIELGSSAGFYPFHLGPYPAPSTATTSVTADWTDLLPGTTYHWRIRYIRDDGTTFSGADQTFTTTGTAGVIPVGHNLALSAASGLYHIDYATSDLGAHYTLTAVIEQTGSYFKSWDIDGVTGVITTNPYVITMNATHFVGVETGFYSADLSVTAESVPPSIGPTDQVTYKLTVKNNGTTSLAPNAEPTATNVKVTDNLPLGMSYISSTATGTTCTEAGGTVTCNVGTLANGATTTVTIVARPAAGLVGAASTNKASVSSSAEDLLMSNNTATVNTTVTAYGVGQITSAAAGTTASKGATNVPMLQLVSMSTGTESMKIEKITIQAGGTGAAADVTSVKLYLDVAGNGVVDAGDPLLASGVFASNNGSLDLTLSSALTVTSGTTPKLLITYDFNTTLASSLPFAVFPLVFAGIAVHRRVRRWMMLLIMCLLVAWFSACGGGGGGGGGGAADVTSNPTTTTTTTISTTPTGTPAAVSTYQVTVTGVTARGATSGNAITIPGLPITGPTVTVNK